MIPDFHVNCTWFYITYYTLFLKKCKQFLFFILYASAITHYQLFFQLRQDKQRFTRGYKRYKETSGLTEWKIGHIFHSIFT